MSPNYLWLPLEHGAGVEKQEKLKMTETNRKHEEKQNKHNLDPGDARTKSTS